MSIFTKLLGGGISAIADVAERFIDTPDKKKKFQLELKTIEAQLTTQLETTHRMELEARADIIKAEMAQGDLYTKRARPSIVYMGLVFIAIVYVIIPVAAYISFLFGNVVENLPELKLPSEFWWAWGTVVSVYGIGRSTEKNGITSKLTNFITGSGANNVKDQ